MPLLSPTQARRQLFRHPLRFKQAWRDGTTHIVYTPHELIEKLIPLIPRPRCHLVRYHGILGPAAKDRAKTVPTPPAPAVPDAAGAEAATRKHLKGSCPRAMRANRGERMSDSASWAIRSTVLGSRAAILISVGKPLTGRVIAARPCMREIGVDGIEPTKTRRAQISRRGRPSAHEFARGAAIRRGPQPSGRG
jgi:hypothetical protein